MLLRKKPEEKDSFNLNPQTAGLAVCRKVHKQKAQAHLMPMKQWQLDQATAESLKSTAEAYAKKLKPFEEMAFEF